MALDVRAWTSTTHFSTSAENYYPGLPTSFEEKFQTNLYPTLSGPSR